mgnify:CR=1 FL=1
MSEQEQAPLAANKELDPVGTLDLMDELDAVFDAQHGNEHIPPEKELAPEPERELEEPDSETLEDVAEEVAEAIPEAVIDYDLEIPMPDGREAMTLGQMKDRVTELERTDAQMIERENALMRQQDELNQLLQAAGQLPPELTQKAAERLEQTLATERQAMMQAIPEWSDRETYDRDRTAIVDVAKQYGFSELEIGQIVDHRVVKFMRDHARLMGERQEAEKLPKQIRKQSRKGTKPRQKTKRSALDQMVDRAMKSNDEDAKFAAIDNLLRG